MFTFGALRVMLCGLGLVPNIMRRMGAAWCAIRGRRLNALLRMFPEMVVVRDSEFEVSRVSHV